MFSPPRKTAPVLHPVDDRAGGLGSPNRHSHHVVIDALPVDVEHQLVAPLVEGECADVDIATIKYVLPLGVRRRDALGSRDGQLGAVEAVRRSPSGLRLERALLLERSAITCLSDRSRDLRHLAAIEGVDNRCDLAGLCDSVDVTVLVNHDPPTVLDPCPGLDRFHHAG